jgi:hypothetical protein
MTATAEQYQAWSPEGFTLAEARERTTDRALWKEWCDRVEGYQDLVHNLKYRRWIGEDAENGRLDLHRLKKALEDLDRRIGAAFRSLLEARRLIAFGRPKTLSNAPCLITADIWPALLDLGWRTSAVGEVRKGGMFYLALRVYPAVKAPGAADLISGHSFVEAFRKFVLEDPEVALLGQAAIKKSPQFKRLFIEGRCHIDGMREWPVAPLYDDPTGLGCLDGKRFPIEFQPKPPPHAVEFAASALADRFAAFLGLLRRGDVVAMGLPQARRFPREIPRSIWSHERFYVNVTTGDLSEMNPQSRDLPHDMLLTQWTALMLERRVPQTVSAVERKANAVVARPRRRPKADAVLAAIEKADIDIAGSALGVKAIVAQIGPLLPFKVSTEAELSALAKMVGRLQKERRSSDSP